jgi:hypothetical protein
MPEIATKRPRRLAYKSFKASTRRVSSVLAAMRTTAATEARAATTSVARYGHGMLRPSGGGIENALELLNENVSDEKADCGSGGKARADDDPGLAP